jgi:hypothetical protein
MLLGKNVPRENLQDRVFRERLTSKLFADYNNAAARGAVLVARGEGSKLTRHQRPIHSKHSSSRLPWQTYRRSEHRSPFPASSSNENRVSTRSTAVVLKVSRDVVAENEAFVPVFEQLSKAAP